MLQALLVDDEQPARKRLRKLLQPLEKAGRIRISGEAVDGIDALEKLRGQNVDLLFLDIQMPGLNGFEVLERIAEEERPVVVFTTAYDEFALQAFEANAVDYLLKPISVERLDEAVKRVEKLQKGRDHRDVSDARVSQLLDWIEERTAEPEGSPPASRTEQPIRQISIPYRDRILLIPVQRLVSAEIHEGITRLYILEKVRDAALPHLHQYIVSYTLDQLEENLDPALFIRVHRSAIVQLDQIHEMIPWFSGRLKLVLTGNHEVIASRERSKMLKERLLL